MEPKNKIKIIAAFVFIIIFVALLSYQLQKSATLKKAEMLSTFDESLKYNDNRTEGIAALYENPLINVTQKCEKERICDINATIKSSAIFYASDTAKSYYGSTKIFAEWHRKKTQEIDETVFCASSRMNSIILSGTLSLSEILSGSARLIRKQSDFTTTLIERFDASKLKNDSTGIEYIKNNVSAEENKMIRTYIEEISRNYAALKDSKMNAFSKSIDEKRVFAINKYGTMDKLENYFCRASTSAQIETYHKEFIEYAYTQFDSLLKANRYEDALPYANILDGFLSQDVQTDN